MLRKIGQLLQSGIFSTTKLIVILGLLALAIMTLLTVADVCARYFLNSPITGTTEIARFCLTVLVFTTLAYCQEKRDHISVDIFFNRFGTRTRGIIRILTELLSIVILGILSRQLFVYAIKTFGTGQTAATIDIPFYPFIYISAVGTALFTLVFLVHFVNTIIEVRKTWT